jgi:hypothetical protein
MPSDNPKKAAAKPSDKAPAKNGVKALFTKPRKAPTLKTKLESMIHEKWEAAIRPIWHIFRTRFGGCLPKMLSFQEKKNIGKFMPLVETRARILTVEPGFCKWAYKL